MGSPQFRNHVGLVPFRHLLAMHTSRCKLAPEERLQHNPLFFLLFCQITTTLHIFCHQRINYCRHYISARLTMREHPRTSQLLDFILVRHSDEVQQILYSWHSLRHAVASSCNAINVSDSKSMWSHNWKSMVVDYATYIDPLWPTTPICYRFFG